MKNSFANFFVGFMLGVAVLTLLDLLLLPNPYKEGVPYGKTIEVDQLGDVVVEWHEVEKHRKTFSGTEAEILKPKETSGVAIPFF